MRYPNPSISSGWTAGPNAVSSIVSPAAFIESGPIKDCRADCKLHPYGSWQNASDDGGYYLDTTALLGTNGLYRYKSVFFGGTGNQQWQAQFCSGSGCRGLITGDLGVDRLPYVISGGESLNSSLHWGDAQTSHAWYKPYNSSTYYGWCYTSTQNNVGGTISACNSADHSWTSTY